MNATQKPEPALFLSDAHGIYIPRDFALSIDHSLVTGVDADTWAILEAGPDHDDYWEAWEDVCASAVVNDPVDGKATVFQDGDCWLIPVGMEWNDKTEWFEWPDDESEGES